MKNGFTLIEVLAVLIVMAILAGLIFPTIENGLLSSSKTALSIEESNIIKSAKDWSLTNIDKLPVNGGSIKVKLGELKQGYLPLNVKNPETGKILSNETYVLITENSGDYNYQVYIYDIPDSINSSDIIIFNGNFLTEEIKIGTIINTYDISVLDSNNNELNYSQQYILNNEEVFEIDTSSKNIYSIIYTVLYNDEIYKAVKTIIIK